VDWTLGEQERACDDAVAEMDQERRTRRASGLQRDLTSASLNIMDPARIDHGSYISAVCTSVTGDLIAIGGAHSVDIIHIPCNVSPDYQFHIPVHGQSRMQRAHEWRRKLSENSTLAVG
jgi:hypothetical protein